MYFHVFFITYKLGASQCQKLLVFDKTRYSVVFEIADYKHELRIKKFKMVRAIWQTRIKKLLDLDKTGWRILGSLITELSSKLINSKWWMQYGGPKCKKKLDSDGTHLNNT